MTVTLTWPTGRTETIFDVPRYNFHEAIAHWDNSAQNPNNPDPGRTVKYGTDEMLNANMRVIVDR